ncbi:hypothetical protein WISP_87148 [Willisornis vidua]|uniref:Uncharacterized protein n=1 Tax=Willisornis vidua TaxID=1566151 RepID=A0ABQ9D8J7_9PASS|nr:hypothetical protein WISP_87148 [Willisornis vidua]
MSGQVLHKDLGGDTDLSTLEDSLCDSLYFTQGEVLQPSIHLHGPPLDSLQQVHIFLVLSTPELYAAFQVGSHESGVQRENHFPQPAGYTSFDAAQNTIGFLGCKHTLLSHVQVFICQNLQVLLLSAALNPFSALTIFIRGITQTQVQYLALKLTESHEGLLDTLLKLVQVPLGGIPSLSHVSRTTQFGVIRKLAVGTFDSTVSVINDHTKQHWSQDRPLRATTRN